MLQPELAEVRATDAERPQVRAVRALVDAAAERVRVRVGDDEVELPRSLVRVLAAAAGSLDEGDAVAVVTEEGTVSPAQAARLLGVSRQYVDRLVGTGVLPAHRIPRSAYRRIPVRAVLAQREDRMRKREGIRKVVADAAAAGLEY
jgi:excisionase family DNA binding protein